ncbi:MAG: FtsX-like permease family protein [Pseudomonadota bacterium]
MARTDLSWVLRTLLSHWPRHPLQAITLVVGLAAATALFSGVQALNFEARESYDLAAQQLGADQLSVFESRTGEPFDESVFAELRRAGWRVSPVVTGSVVVEGRRVTVMGVDLVSLPATAAVRGLNGVGADQQESTDLTPLVFMRPPYVSLAARQTLKELNLAANDQPLTRDEQTLPRVVEVDGMAPLTLIMDIAAAQTVLDKIGKIDRLLIATEQRSGLLPVSDITDTKLIERLPPTTSDTQQLTGSFHLNLTAFGFLSFFVGLLIVHGAIGLSFEQRRPMLRTLIACGASKNELTLGLIIELAIFAIVAGLIGLVLGYIVAALLLPDVALTLISLYGAQVPGSLTFRASWWGLGLAISLLGTLATAAKFLWAIYQMPVIAPAQPQAWLSRNARSHRVSVITAVIFLSVGVLFLTFVGGLFSGFLIMGAVMASAALVFPVLFSVGLRLAEGVAGTSVTKWFWADGRQQLPAMSLALQALLLALAVNIGVGAMVGSFRDTFTGWLDQRLAAELYVNAPVEKAREIEAFLTEGDTVETILPVMLESTRYESAPLRIMGITPHPTYSDNWPLIAAISDPWARLEDNEGVLINEQLARRFGYRPGENIVLDLPNGPWNAVIAGIYSDYGNPVNEIMVPIDRVANNWPETQQTLFLLRMDPAKTSGLSAELQDRFGLQQSNMIDQSGLKDFSLQIFERTFSVTAALTVLTLIVAGVAMLTSLLSLSISRLPQVAPLWAMGLTRGQLAALDLVKSLLFAGVTALLAIPLGLVIAFILTDIINVEAFGWQLPMTKYPAQWLVTIAMAVATTCLAALPSFLAMRRSEPTELLRAFANDR